MAGTRRGPLRSCSCDKPASPLARADARSRRHASAPSGRVPTTATAGERARTPAAAVERLVIVLSVAERTPPPPRRPSGHALPVRGRRAADAGRHAIGLLDIGARGRRHGRPQPAAGAPSSPARRPDRLAYRITGAVLARSLHDRTTCIRQPHADVPFAAYRLLPRGVVRCKNAQRSAQAERGQIDAESRVRDGTWCRPSAAGALGTAMGLALPAITGSSGPPGLIRPNPLMAMVGTPLTISTMGVRGGVSSRGHG